MSSANASTPGMVTIMVPSDLPTILGPVVLGLFFNWCLLGVLGSQVYIYYLCFPNDSRYIKGLVYTLSVLEIAQTCLVTNDAWQLTILAWGHPELLGEIHLQWLDLPIMTGITSTAVQLFFAWRIWKLSKSPIVAGVIGVVALLQGSAALATGVQLERLGALVHKAIVNPQQVEGHSFAAQAGKVLPAVSVWLAGSAATDILIAVAMTYLLTRRTKNGMHETNDIIARLVRLTVETGTLTATVAVVDLIFFNASKTSNLHICPAMILAKLYTNTLMVLFNNRIFMHRPVPSTTSGSTSSGAMHFADHYRGRHRDAISSGGSKTLDVNISQDAFKDTNSLHGNDVPLGQIQVHTVREVHTTCDETDSDSRPEKYPGHVG